MSYMNLKKLIIILFSFLLNFSVLAEEIKIEDNNTEFNVYTLSLIHI